MAQHGHFLLKLIACAIKSLKNKIFSLFAGMTLASGSMVILILMFMAKI